MNIQPHSGQYTHHEITHNGMGVDVVNGAVEPRGGHGHLHRPVHHHGGELHDRPHFPLSAPPNQVEVFEPKAPHRHRHHHPMFGKYQSHKPHHHPLPLPPKHHHAFVPQHHHPAPPPPPAPAAHHHEAVVAHHDPHGYHNPYYYDNSHAYENHEYRRYKGGYAL